ncbi:WAT1-related protein At5g40230-like [Quercus robur]|uniref:WAT1-related protein At5g40230-like n=1 Tax=Quercus robur TaxID=38942 RepID=UPI0021622F2B|nr:WAT1-related protein At5g40230-like [Quercus robur]
MASSYWYKDVLPFSAMVAVECTNVGVNTLYKAATLKGLSYYDFVFYSFAIATIVLLPLVFIFRRTTGLPTFQLSLLYRIFLLGVIGFLARLSEYIGIEYSSPTLASAVSNLTPAFTFILAVIFRMEVLALRSSITQAKIMGTLVSISGALIVVFYEGPTIISIASQAPPLPHHFPLGSSQTKWVIGGLLLAVEYLLTSIWFIVQAQVMKIYPAEFTLVFLYFLFATIVSAPVCLIAERNFSAFRLRPNIALAAIVYSGIGLSLSTIVHTWGLHLKGPVYVSIFKPLSIAIAAAMGVIFLGDALYLGSIIGAIILSIGFYAVIWAKAKEDLSEDSCCVSLGSSSDSKTPLLDSNLGSSNNGTD